MKISFFIDNTAVSFENCFLVFNNKIICISDKNAISFDIDNQGEYGIQIITGFQRKSFCYILLLWFWNLLIAPLNIILMNTDSEWYRSTSPTMFWNYKCYITSDMNLRFRIIPSYNGKYAVELLSHQDCFTELSYQEIYSKDSVIWEMNKYLSRFFSVEFWTFGVLYLIFRYVSFHNWYLITVITGVLLAVLFSIVATYTVKKAMRLIKTQYDG